MLKYRIMKWLRADIALFGPDTPAAVVALGAIIAYCVFSWLKGT